MEYFDQGAEAQANKYAFKVRKRGCHVECCCGVLEFAVEETYKSFSRRVAPGGLLDESSETGCSTQRVEGTEGAALMNILFRSCIAPMS